MKPPTDDLERRRPVWEAISEFFLDTELEATDHERIATILLNSRYSDSDLYSIMWKELCPVLGANLASMAGEWAGFNMEYVEQQIILRPAGALRRWWSYLIGGNIARSPWERVHSILQTQHTR